MSEIQVFRLTPEVGRFYYTTTYTRKAGKWPNETYYSTKALRYVGQFVKHYQLGAGDGAIHYDIFKDGDKVNKVDYTYEGTTCFVETNPPASYYSSAIGIASSAASIESYKNKKQQSVINESDISFGIDPLPPVEVPAEAPKTAIKTAPAKKAASTATLTPPAATTSSSNKVEYCKDVYIPKPPPESPPDTVKKRKVCCCIQ